MSVAAIFIRLADTEPLHHLSTCEVLKTWKKDLDFGAFGAYVGWAEIPFWEDLRNRFELPLPAEKLARLRTKAYAGILKRKHLPPLPGVVRLLTALRAAEVPCAVASSSPRPQIAATLESAGLTGFIKEYVSGHDDVKHG
ncbi:MAG: HAD family phosphatase, partial [Chloroflexi bacterium]|nr:HAD family phosphatase [Chloroflexota bacterium]